MYLQIKFHGPVSLSIRHLKKGVWYIETALENTLLSKGLKGIQLYILEEIIDLHLCITSKYNTLLLLFAFALNMWKKSSYVHI